MLRVAIVAWLAMAITLTACSGSRSGSEAAVTSSPTVAASPTVAVVVAPPTREEQLAALEATVGANWDKDWPKAVAALKELDGLDHAGPWLGKLYEAYASWGAGLVDQKNWAEANRVLGEAIALDPSRPEAQGVLASIPPPTPVPTATPVLVAGRDEPLIGKNWVYLIKSAQAIHRVKTLKWTSVGNVLTAKGQYLVIEIGLLNKAKQNFGIAPRDFELQDAGGTTYRPSTEFGISGALELNYGIKAVGPSGTDAVPPDVAVLAGLVFDINPEAKGLKLKLNQENKFIPID